MSLSVNAKVNVEIILNQIVTSGIKNGNVPVRFLEAFTLANGTTDGTEIDVGYYVQETGKAASSTTVYDLAGTLTDEDGGTITFAEVALVAVRNLRTTAQATITVGPDATAGAGILGSGRGFWVAAQGSGGGSVCHPDSGWVIHYAKDGFPVTATTADELSIICSAVAGDTNSWDLVILGRSA